MSDTKERILDVAERLFAEQGFGNTSLRQIITEAGVNLAAVHYHFGSKEDLLDELVHRRADPVNQMRMETLERLEAEAGGKPLPVEVILEAFMEPGIQAAMEHPSMIRLAGRIHAEGLGQAVMRKHFEPVARRFVASLRHALPGLAEDEFMLRLRFVAGALVFSVQDERLAEGTNVRWLISSLIAFLKGGLLAPASLPNTEPRQAIGEKVEVEI